MYSEKKNHSYFFVKLEDQCLVLTSSQRKHVVKSVKCFQIFDEQLCVNNKKVRLVVHKVLTVQPKLISLFSYSWIEWVLAELCGGFLNILSEEVGRKLQTGLNQEDYF